MSTRLRSDDTRTDARTDETRSTMTTPTETTGAQLMFSTDNEVPIRGLFDAESDDNGA